jgi:hypothetical protein
MVYWPDYPTTDPLVSLVESYKQITSFERLFKKYPKNTLFGPKGPDEQGTA